MKAVYEKPNDKRHTNSGRGQQRKPIVFKNEKQLSDEAIVQAKLQIIETIESGKAVTPTGAADLLGYPAVRVRHWLRDDKDFSGMCRTAREAFGDRMIEALSNEKNIIAKIFLIKGIYPEFRDNYRVSSVDSKMQALLEELKRVTGQQTVTVEKPKDVPRLASPWDAVITKQTDSITPIGANNAES